MKNTLLSLLVVLGIMNNAQAQCNAPTNLQTSYANNVTTFDWDPVSGAVSYTIELKQAWDSWAYPEYIDVTTNDVYTLTGIMQSISIDWRVKTVCANGESVYQYAPTFTLPCPQPGNLTTTNISMTGATLNWTPAPGYNTTVSDFYVSYRQAGGSWIYLSNTQATNKVISNLKANTTYEWRVGQTCAYSNSGAVTSSFTTLACNSAGANSTEWIVNFKAGSINRTSAAEAGGYVNTGLSTNLTRGVSNSCRIKVGNSGQFISKNYKVYIDYNNNNICEETEVAYGPAAINSTGNINFNFTVPTTAALGARKMRVIMARTGVNITGCMSGFNGETEDYVANITGTGNKSAEEESFAGIVEEQKKITLFPNPVTEVLNIQLPAEVSTVSVYDMMGKRVYQQQASAGKMQVDVAQWPASQYMVEAVYADGHKDVVRFAKQ